jgi:prepilin-type N-terminal cleavage/methylation domain-containing protein
MCHVKEGEKMRKQGFTLIEVIIAIAIIAILASVVAPKAFKAIEKAKVTRVSADMRSVKAAATSYYSDVGLWPPDVCPQEDPGFIDPDNYQNRCCGQNYNYLPANYQTVISTNWDGPYLEKFPFPTPWGGSYDWEYWPGGGWSQPPGVYVSVRPRYISFPQGTGCAYAAPQSATDVPADFEIKLQQQGIDEYHQNGVNATDNPTTVIVRIMQF